MAATHPLLLTGNHLSFSCFVLWYLRSCLLSAWRVANGALDWHSGYAQTKVSLAFPPFLIDLLIASLLCDIDAALGQYLH